MTELDVVFTADCGCRYRLQPATAALRGAVLTLVEMCKRHIAIDAANYREAQG